MKKGEIKHAKHVQKINSTYYVKQYKSYNIRLLKTAWQNTFANIKEKWAYSKNS